MSSYIGIKRKSPYIKIKTKSPYIEIKTKSPYTKYIIIFYKNDTIFALHLDYAVHSSWLHNVVHKPSD